MSLLQGLKTMVCMGGKQKTKGGDCVMGNEEDRDLGVKA